MKCREKRRIEVRGTFGWVILNVLYANRMINLKFICLLRNDSCKLSNKLRVLVNEGLVLMYIGPCIIVIVGE